MLQRQHGLGVGFRDYPTVLGRAILRCPDTTLRSWSRLIINAGGVGPQTDSMKVVLLRVMELVSIGDSLVGVPTVHVADRSGQGSNRRRFEHRRKIPFMVSGCNILCGFKNVQEVRGFKVYVMGCILILLVQRKERQRILLFITAL